uniref:RBR-type E3 ubiquitin transferase n=1 Tax=Solanum lycopersicum TaxID=4081 RepID=A0A3Q7GUZ2_SOLLC
MASSSRNRRHWDGSNDNGDDYDSPMQLLDSEDDDDGDIQLQQILFYSAMSKPKSNPNDVKKKGIDYSCSFVETDGVSLRNSEYEKGGPSYVVCTMCNEPTPPNDDDAKHGPNCGHIYCKECFFGYTKKNIKETLTYVKCPVSDCKEYLLINENFIPPEFRNQWRETVREAEALYSCRIIECPFLGCLGYLIDDKKGFLIRTCPKCWTLFCVMCRDNWHKGMDCRTNYQWKRKIRSLVDAKKDDDDKGAGDEYSNLLSLLRHFKNS